MCYDDWHCDGGMVQNRTWRVVGSSVPVPRADVDEERQVLRRDSAVRVEATWEKMSKSKFNGIEPADMLQRHGADATRLFVLFRALPTMALE
jgi:leucyl-tRNA synthetase